MIPKEDTKMNFIEISDDIHKYNGVSFHDVDEDHINEFICDDKIDFSVLKTLNIKSLGLNVFNLKDYSFRIHGCSPRRSV